MFLAWKEAETGSSSIKLNFLNHLFMLFLAHRVLKLTDKPSTVDCIIIIVAMLRLHILSDPVFIKSEQTPPVLMQKLNLYILTR